jgi:hypothetical protein
MTIQTNAEFERARTALESKSPKELTAFILSLAFAPDGIGNYVHMLAASDDLATLTELVNAELADLRKGERESNYRHRQGSRVVRRVDRFLDALETMLLPAYPSGAFHALAHFIESDEEIGSNCGEDHFGASQAFDRACELLLTIAQSLPAAQTEQVLERLRSHDDFGLRTKLACVSSPTGNPNTNARTSPARPAKSRIWK